MTVEIITNNVPRELIYWDDLTAKEKERFDWVDDTDSFVRYCGHVYALSEFTTSAPAGWDGIAPDSYFSGVLCKLAPVDSDGQVIMGRYYA